MIENDPYETTNLYDTSDEMKEIQAKLYIKLDEMTQTKTKIMPSLKSESICFPVWESSNNYIVPWLEPEDGTTLIAARQTSTYPNNCGMYSVSLKSNKITPYKQSSLSSLIGH